jgi:phage portal protein BeeE
MSIFERVRSMLPGYQQKASLVGSLLRVFTLGNAVWTPRQYDKLAQVAYQCNVIGYKAVTLISRSFAGIPIGLYEEDGDEVEKHPVLDLLRRPNPWQSGKRFRENLCGYFCLAGNAYVEGVDAELTGDEEEEDDSFAQPLQLFTHRPDRMTIKLSKLGTPEQYVYKAQGGERKWSVDPFTGAGKLLHVKTFNPSRRPAGPSTSTTSRARGTSPSSRTARDRLGRWCTSRRAWSVVR